MDRKDCFFTGSVSTLRTHISRRKGHVKVYVERCEALGIEPHPCALLKGFDSDRSQGSLDSIVTREPKRPHFTMRGLMDYIVQLIVCKDEVSVLFTLIITTLLICVGFPVDRSGNVLADA